MVHEILADRRWTWKLLFLYKIILELLPSYLKDYLISCDNLRTYLTRSLTQKIIKTFPARTKTFESSFFPHCPGPWGNLSEECRNIKSINTFKSSISNFTRPRKNSVFIVHDTNSVKPWNYNTGRNNILENPLLYARLSLQMVHC